MSDHALTLSLIAVSALALLSSFAYFFIAIWRPHSSVHGAKRLTRLFCAVCLAAGACLELIKWFRLGSPSSGLCGLVCATAAAVWLSPERPSDGNGGSFDHD